MTAPLRTKQEILEDQFRLTARLSGMTGEYHRRLQKLSAAGFARQLAEHQGDAAAFAQAERDEAGAQAEADQIDETIRSLEQELNALARELAAQR